MRKKTILVVLAGALLWGGLGSANAVVNCECMVGDTYELSVGGCRTIKYECIDPWTACHGI